MEEDHDWKFVVSESKTKKNVKNIFFNRFSMIDK
jgi:hypothetical protein